MLPMPIQVYDQIINLLKSKKLSECQNALEENYPSTPMLTLGSIFSNFVQRKMKGIHSKINSPEKSCQLYEWFKNEVTRTRTPGVIIRISDELEITPVLVARGILEGFIRSSGNFSPNDNERGVNYQEIRSEIGRLLNDTTKIPDRDLSYEVYLATVHDTNYGPIPDSVKAAIGIEYENLLQAQLTEKKILFSDENKLRGMGFDKTPDFRLEVPISIDGQIVNWIESKATFGDEETHTDYINSQLRSYWNRFGPGMVIYWLGYVDTLPSRTDFAMLIKDHLPSNIVHFDPLSISFNELKISNEDSTKNETRAIFELANKEIL